MTERENLPVRRRRRRRKRRMWLPVFLHIAFLTGCLTVLLSITGNAFHNKNAHDGMVSSEEGRESPVSETDDSPDNGGPGEPEDTDAFWYLALVNSQNPLPDDYSHDICLTDVPGGEKVDGRIYGPLMEMMEAAQAENLGPIVVSGYRTPEKQQSLYDDKIKEYRKQGYSEDEAVELAQQWVARPGTSEHQLGLAVDINGAVYDIYFWLQENSYKYGFIFRYPGNKTHITGVAEEVWHYRYVGKEAAAEIYERGICLEEYLENPQGLSADGQNIPEPEPQGQPGQDEAVCERYELINGEWTIVDASSCGSAD